jgi:hypothetical protein
MLLKRWAAAVILGVVCWMPIPGLCGPDHDHHGHEHHGKDADAAEHAASHGGALVGLEYSGKEVAHLEMVLEPSSGTLTVYLMDEAAHDAVRIPQETIDAVVLLPGAAKAIPLEFAAVENAESGETTGDTSVFSVRSEALKGAERFSVSIASIFVQGYEVNDIRFAYPEGDH